MKRIVMIAAVAAIGLAGCTSTSMTPDEYMTYCTNRVKYWDITFKSELQHYMGVSKDQVPEVFCRRVMKGIQQGRITQKDLIEAFDKSSRLWPVIKGR